MLLIFDSTHQALTAEEVLESLGLEIDVRPAPVVAHGDCGLAIEVEAADQERAQLALTEADVAFSWALPEAPEGR